MGYILKAYLEKSVGMRKKFLFASFIVSVLSLISVHPAVAQNQKSYVIGVEDLEYYPLWRYDASLKEYRGLGRKLLDAFAKSKGYTFEYKPLPIKRLVRELVDKKIDFKFPDSPYWANDVKGNAEITYSEPAIKFTDGVFVKPENMGKGDASIKTLGSVLGFTPWDWLERIQKKEVILKETPDFGALINQAISDRIDGAYANTEVVRYHLDMEGRQGALVFDKGLPHVEGNYTLSTTLHPDVIKEFNDWLANNQALISRLRKEMNIR